MNATKISHVHKLEHVFRFQLMGGQQQQQRFGTTSNQNQTATANLRAELEAKLEQHRNEQARNLEMDRRRTLEKMALDLCGSGASTSGGRQVSSMVFV